MAKRPMYLQHVNVYVRNVERSKKWYEDLLGLHVYEYRPGWAAFLSADEEQSHEVALMQLGDDAPLQVKGQVGLNHMAWRLESLDDLKEFYWKIKAEGQPIDHISDHGISLGIYLRDLTDHATQPQFIYRHVWRPHDFVIWDNRCTMHRARPFDDKTHRRELRRTTSLDLPLPASAQASC